MILDTILSTDYMTIYKKKNCYSSFSFWKLILDKATLKTAVFWRTDLSAVHLHATLQEQLPTHF